MWKFQILFFFKINHLTRSIWDGLTGNNTDPRLFSGVFIFEFQPIHHELEICLRIEDNLSFDKMGGSYIPDIDRCIGRVFVNVKGSDSEYLLTEIISIVTMPTVRA